MPLFIFWIIFLLDLELNFIGKLLVFRWELIVLLLLQICFFFVMREISWSLSHVKIRLTILRLSIQLLDTLTSYKILTIFTLTKWWTGYTLQQYYSDTEASFLDLNLCISNGTVSTKIYDKQDDFDFDIVNFPFLDGDVPRRTSYGVYISQLIRFARASSNLNDFNYRNKALTAKLLRQGYRCYKLRKAFSKLYRRHSALVEKYSVSLKTLLQQGISEPEFYGDLVYRFRKIVGKSKFRSNSENLLTVIKELAIACILCGRLHT